MAADFNVFHAFGGKAEPFSLEVTRGQKGTYAFVFKQYGNDPKAMIKKAREIMDECLEAFPVEGTR